MPNIQHSALTGSDLHEPKGADTAAANTIYIANGAGSGSWGSPPAASIAVADVAGKFAASDVEAALLELYQEEFTVEGHFTDISNVETLLLPVPFDCTLLRVNIILTNAITVANSIVTLTRSDGASLGSTLTITQAGSTEGTTFQYTPSSNQNFTYASHKYLKLVSDGGSTTACKAVVQALFRRT